MLEEGGVVGDKIKVIYNGMPDDCFQISDRSAAAALLAGHKTWRPDRLTVGITAGLKPVKNHVGLLNAASSVIGDVPEAQLLIVGDGPLKPHLRAAAASLGIEERTTFYGETSDTRTLLAAMDVFVLCSFHEGMPNALLEAMAAGRAVIATKNGGCPEIVRHGRSGFLVNPEDAASMAERISRLLRSKDLRAAFGSAARDTVASKFTLERMVQEFEQLYADILTPVARETREPRYALPAMCW